MSRGLFLNFSSHPITIHFTHCDLFLKDCELLENEICSQEYAIAKKHHLLGRVVHLPNCSSLPKTNCFELGIEKPEVNEGKKKYIVIVMCIN